MRVSTLLWQTLRCVRWCVDHVLGLFASDFCCRCFGSRAVMSDCLSVAFRHRWLAKIQPAVYHTLAESVSEMVTRTISPHLVTPKEPLSPHSCSIWGTYADHIFILQEDFYIIQDGRFFSKCSIIQFRRFGLIKLGWKNRQIFLIIFKSLQISYLIIFNLELIITRLFFMCN